MREQIPRKRLIQDVGNAKVVRAHKIKLVIKLHHFEKHMQIAIEKKKDEEEENSIGK